MYKRKVRARTNPETMLVISIFKQQSNSFEIFDRFLLTQINL